MDGALFGTPENEVESIIADRLKDYIQEVDEQTEGGATGHVGDSFEKIAFGLKLIPNMDQANYLLKKMSMVGGEESGYDGLEGSLTYSDAIGDYSDYPHFFEWNGAAHVAFPQFSFDIDHVPIGNSVNMCLGLSWITKKKSSQYDKYVSVKGFNDCVQYETGRSQWEPDYPQKGLNFRLWDQNMARGDTVCENGIY